MVFVTWLEKVPVCGRDSVVAFCDNQRFDGTVNDFFRCSSTELLNETSVTDWWQNESGKYFVELEVVDD